MIENLFRGHPPGEQPLHLNPFFIRVKSVVLTAVFRFNSHEIADYADTENGPQRRTHSTTASEQATICTARGCCRFPSSNRVWLPDIP